MIKASHPGRGKSAPAMRHKLLGSAASVVLTAVTLTMAAAQPTMAADLTAAAKPYQIAPGPLQNVLAAYASANQLAISVDPALVANKQSPGLVGSYSKQQGLEQILQGTGLGLRATGSNAYSVYALGASASASAASTTLKAIEVKAQSPEEVEKQAVYRKSVSTIYMDETNFSKLKGSNVADIFRGQIGVYSGDARNGDTLDPNIRGVQGQGRIPVTIDGTEQAITKSKGFYTGTSNANYIDPNLIAGGTAVKGAAISRDVQTSSGGGIALRTIGARDILKPGQRFGMRIKIDGESNTTSPRFPNPIPAGLNYYGDVISNGKLKPEYSTTVVPRDKPTLFNSKSGSVMAALAWQNEKFNALAAYSYRQRGNYFAGQYGAAPYRSISDTNWEEHELIPPVALHYKPGKEVTNTSNRAESWLLKGEWNINEDMLLGLGARQTKMYAGSITPATLKGITQRYMPKNEVFQKPETESQQKAYNLDYSWKPENRPWIDLQAKLWNTQTNSLEPSNAPFGDMLQQGWPKLSQAAKQLNIKNDRTGFAISNKFQLSKKLNLLLGADYQHESLRSVASWSSSQRAGQRDESSIYFNVNWQPLEWLEFDVGAKRRAFSIKDEGYLNLLASPDGSGRNNPIVALEGVIYLKGEETDARRQAVQNLIEKRGENEDLWNGFDSDKFATSEQFMAASNKLYDNSYDHEALSWLIPLDKDGKIASVPAGVTQERLDELFHGTISMNDFDPRSRKVKWGQYIKLLDANRPPPDDKSQATGWAPSFGVTLKAFNSRLYWRYAQDIRMPSMAEGTHGGHIISLHNRDYFGFNPLKPERARNMELGLSHDLSRFFKQGTTADIKIAWFDQTIKGAIDTVNVPGLGFMSANLERQKLRGIELQSRFDNGRVFAEFGATKTLKNKVCDRTRALINSSYIGEIPDNCVNYGFPFGILRHAKQPKYSLGLLLGGRVLDNKLELGTRITHFSDYDRSTESYRLTQDAVGIPVNWTASTVVDAYANYQINKQTMLEFSAMNLTNQYYVDPLTRSWMPAPGRAFRLGVRIDL